jgi:hypothetical protein
VLVGARAVCYLSEETDLPYKKEGVLLTLMLMILRIQLHSFSFDC